MTSHETLNQPGPLDLRGKTVTNTGLGLMAFTQMRSNRSGSFAAVFSYSYSLKDCNGAKRRT